jgi:hypothetical protein
MVSLQNSCFLAGLGTSFDKISAPASFVTRNEDEIAGSVPVGKSRGWLQTKPGDLDAKKA